MLRDKKGMVLPIALVMVIVLSVLMFSIVFRTQTSTKGVYKDYISQNKYHGMAHSGINKAEFKLKSPNNPGSEHTWTDGHTDEFDISLPEGGNVNVKIKDKTK